MSPHPPSRPVRPSLALAAALAVLLPSFARPAEPPADSAPWPAERRREVLDRTLEVRLAPDLAHLAAGERRAVEELLAVGEIMQRLYEDARHHQAAEARRRLAAMPAGEEAAELATLYRLFQGPIATTLDNRREPFLAVDPEVPGKDVYPWGIEKAEVEAFLAAHPEAREEVLGERTVVRRTTAEDVSRDRAALGRHPALAVLHPRLVERLATLAAALGEGAPAAPPALYAVPYAVAWADELGEAQRRLFAAADAVEGEDAELARYLRNRGRDLLTNDYESGDASWVTGRFGRLNAQIGAYETYDDALFGVKAFHSLSLLADDREATEELTPRPRDLQAIEDALPYEPPQAGALRHPGRRLPVDRRLRPGARRQHRDDPAQRPPLRPPLRPHHPAAREHHDAPRALRPPSAVWRAAVGAGARRRSGHRRGRLPPHLWHEIGHYLGPDRTRDGRTLDVALQVLGRRCSRR
jgi:hypothetical protein